MYETGAYLNLYLEARSQIRIRIKSKRYDPDPHQSDKQDPDPHQRDADPQHWLKISKNTKHVASCVVSLTTQSI
jgi:hypothetical protein